MNCEFTIVGYKLISYDRKGRPHYGMVQISYISNDINLKGEMGFDPFPWNFPILY